MVAGVAGSGRGIPARRPLLRAARKLGRRVAAVLRPARPVLANLARTPLTVAGFGCLDAAAVIWNTTVGVACAGVLLIVLEHLIADERT